jgi:hypothetical protein
MAGIIPLTLASLALTMHYDIQMNGSREEILSEAQAEARNTEGANPVQARPGETLR